MRATRPDASNSSHRSDQSIADNISSTSRISVEDDDEMDEDGDEDESDEAEDTDWQMNFRTNVRFYTWRVPGGCIRLIR